MMGALVLHLQSATQYERIEGVTSFVGEDASGSFDILPGHERLITVLASGLARFRVSSDPWQYLALPGAVVYLLDDELYLSTRRYLRESDYRRISAALEAQLLAEEESLRVVKESLHQMEEAMFKRLWQMGRGRP